VQDLTPQKPWESGMETSKREWTQLHEESGVVLGEFTPESGNSWLVVADEDFEHYRLTFSSTDDGNVHVGVDAEWSERPGELANFTSEVYTDCGPNDTLSITENGLLTVLSRKRAATTVDFRTGFTLELPAVFVPVVRKAIRLARARALLATGSISAERFQELLLEDEA
jgi:hypothetical protein